MNSHPGIHRYLAAVVMCLTGLASLPAQAEEAAVESVIASKPGVTQLLGRILDDPHRGYQRVQGPDDCNSEEMYLTTRKVLQEYVATPAEKQAELRDYILSGKAACNCTRAIVGKEINTLLKEVGMEMSELPCL
jgi:hypothetical protein